MNAALFQALSQAIFTSLGHALVIYLLARMLLLSIKDLSSSWRYNLLYSSLVLICAGFLISFFRYYIAAVDIPKITAGSFTSPANRGALTVSTLISSYSVWIARVYSGGLIIQAFFLLLAVYRLKFKNFTDCKPAPVFWSKRLDDLKLKLDVSKTTVLYFSDKILIPFTAGYLKPVILFPLATINQLSVDQVEAILLHELAHISRSDYLMNILQRVMEIILFFNPVTWLLAKEIRAEREYCCDDIVVQYTSNPNNYARALSIIEEHKMISNSLAMPATGKKHNLLNRIKKITNMKPQNSNSKSRLFALLGILAISLSLAWVVPADTTKNKQLKDEVRPNKLKDPDQPLVPPAPPKPMPIEILKGLKVPAPPIRVPSAPSAPPAPVDTNELKQHFNSPEWKKQMQEIKVETEKIKKQFDSPEWKKQMEAMKVETEKMQKQFNSPEWKKQMEGMKVETEKLKKQFDSPEWKKQMEAMKVETEKMKKQFDSPEWKKQMEDMKVETEKMQKQFNSPEWKKQMEEMKVETEKMKRQFDSPEWKKKIKESELKEENNKEDL